MLSGKAARMLSGKEEGCHRPFQSARRPRAQALDCFPANQPETVGCALSEAVEIG
jgi:hypothetical protein